MPASVRVEPASWRAFGMFGRRGRASEPWGIGLADDSWSSMASVHDWGTLEADEFVRFFPGLMPEDGAPAPEALDHLADMVVARAWRAGRRGPVAPLAVGAATVLARGARLHADHFGAPTMLARLVPRSPAGDAEGECATLGMLDRLLHGLRRGTGPAPEAALALEVAFQAGLHPAYLWPAFATMHERMTLAAWLGLVHRGRAALMPFDIAETVLGIVDGRDARAAVVHDEGLAPYIERTLAPAALWQAAAAAWNGRPTLVRRTLPAGRLPATAGLGEVRSTHFAPT